MGSADGDDDGDNVDFEHPASDGSFDFQGKNNSTSSESEVVRTDCNSDIDWHDRDSKQCHRLIVLIHVEPAKSASNNSKIWTDVTHDTNDSTSCPNTMY